MALRRMVTLGARWLSSSSGISSRNLCGRGGGGEEEGKRDG